MGFLKTDDILYFYSWSLVVFSGKNLDIPLPSIHSKDEYDLKF